MHVADLEFKSSKINSQKILEEYILSYVISQPNETKNDLLKKLIEVADRGQFYNLFLAKKIIINNVKGTYTKNQFCHIEGLSSKFYSRIVTEYVPMVRDVVCTKNYDLNSSSDFNDYKTLLGRRVHKNYNVLV
ncbi:hypothetical protein D3C71_1827890 [compost metagenome]